MNVRPLRTVLAVVVTAASAWGLVAAERSGAASAPLFGFGVIADVQYRDGDPSGTRFYRESSAKLAAAVERFNELRPAFVVQLGDLIDGASASYDVMLPIMARLRAPAYHVLGNHDQSVEAGQQREVPKRLGLDRLGPGLGYYDFARNGWRFVVLNGNDVSAIASPEGSPERRAADAMLEELKTRKAPNAQTWNGGVGAAQQAWLERTLARAAAAGERVVAFCHFPVLPPGPATLWNDREVLAVLEASPAMVAYFSGHEHRGGYAEQGGVHFVTLRGVVEGHDSAYALVEVYPDRLELKGFGREPSRTLRYRGATR
jgi:manganese-dependent ADP-ribose/CDP-alcohol diphosphatase